MDDKDIFNQIMKSAVENKSEDKPQSPQEFDVYCDMDYNLYMFIKGEWSSIGVNVESL
jgi:hypothetical protein